MDEEECEGCEECTTMFTPEANSYPLNPWAFAVTLVMLVAGIFRAISTAFSSLEEDVMGAHNHHVARRKWANAAHEDIERITEASDG